MIPKLLTIEEVAEVTRTPLSSVRSWVYSGRLTTIKPGRHRLVMEEALRQFLGVDDVQSASDSAAPAAIVPSLSAARRRQPKVAP